MEGHFERVPFSPPSNDNIMAYYSHDIMSGQPHPDYAYSANPGAMNGFNPAQQDDYNFGMSDESFDFINNMATTQPHSYDASANDDETWADFCATLDPSNQAYLNRSNQSPLPPSQPPPPFIPSTLPPLGNSRVRNATLTQAPPAAQPLNPPPPTLNKAPVIPSRHIAPPPRPAPTSAPLSSESTTPFDISAHEDARLFTESRKGGAVKKAQYQAVADFIENQRRGEQRFLIANGISANGFRDFATGLSRHRNSKVNRWCFFMKSEVAKRMLTGKGESAKPVKHGERATQYARMFSKMKDSERAELKAEMVAAQLRVKEDTALVGLEVHGEHRQTRINEVDAYQELLREQAQIMHSKHAVHTLTLVSSSHVLDANPFWISSMGGTAFLHTFNYDATLLLQRFTALCVTGATVNLQREARLDESKIKDIEGVRVSDLRSMLGVLYRDIFNTALAKHNLEHSVPAVKPSSQCTYTGFANLGLRFSLTSTSSFTAHDYRNPTGTKKTAAKGGKEAREKSDAMSALDLNRIIPLVRAGALQFSSIPDWTPARPLKRSRQAATTGKTGRSGAVVAAVNRQGQALSKEQVEESDDEPEGGGGGVSTEGGSPGGRSVSEGEGE
ncbi:hypothetical protein P7C70_g611, partial [Phenoliferia sp. Uapishka_3]